MEISVSAAASIAPHGAVRAHATGPYHDHRSRRHDDRSHNDPAVGLAAGSYYYTPIIDGSARIANSGTISVQAGANSYFATTVVGVYLDEGTTGTTIRRCKFVAQSRAAIGDYKGVGNRYYDNDFRGIAAGAVPISYEYGGR